MPDMHPLGRLIGDLMAKNGWSLDQVVARAEQRGESLGRSNLNRLRQNPPESLTRRTLFGIAAGLGVTPLTVANAALESMGIRPLAVETTDTLVTVDIDPSLSEHDRRRLHALIAEMRSDVPPGIPQRLSGDPKPGPGGDQAHGS